MEYFKTVEGMLTSAFAERGYLDDNGNPIAATEQPMTKNEFITYKKAEMENKIKSLKSKVAICPNCDGFVLACDVDHLDKDVEKEFTQLTNEGFQVKLETFEETQARRYAPYSDCVDSKCKIQPE